MAFTPYIREISIDLTVPAVTLVSSTELVLGSACPWLYCEVTRTDSSADNLDQFILQIQTHPDGDWTNLITTDWTTLDKHLLAVQGSDPTTLTKTQTGSFVVWVGPAHSIRFQAAKGADAGADAAVELRGHASSVGG